MKIFGNIGNPADRLLGSDKDHLMKLLVRKQICLHKSMRIIISSYHLDKENYQRLKQWQVNEIVLLIHNIIRKCGIVCNKNVLVADLIGKY